MSKVIRFAIASSVVVFGATLVACGGGGPPPRPTEVPMDPSSGGSTSTTSAAADPTPPSTTSNSSADPSSGMAGMGDPTAATVASSPPPDPPDDPKPGKSGKGKGKGKGKKGDPPETSKGGGLTRTECQALSDKGVDLLLAGMGGLDPSMAAQIKAQAAGDPNMAGMMTECLKSNTKAQYKCGMAAGSKDEWEKCLK